jgi:hypothetical protein
MWYPCPHCALTAIVETPLTFPAITFSGTSITCFAPQTGQTAERDFILFSSPEMSFHHQFSNFYGLIPHAELENIHNET